MAAKTSPPPYDRSDVAGTGVPEELDMSDATGTRATEELGTGALEELSTGATEELSSGATEEPSVGASEELIPNDRLLQKDQDQSQNKKEGFNSRKIRKQFTAARQEVHHHPLLPQSRPRPP